MSGFGSELILYVAFLGGGSVFAVMFLLTYVSLVALEPQSKRITKFGLSFAAAAIGGGASFFGIIGNA